MHTCGFRINAKLVKEGSFRINVKLVKEGLLNWISRGIWMPLYVEVIKGSHPEYTYENIGLT